MSKALLAAEVVGLMDDGWMLVNTRGWFWLMKNNETPRLVNCNSAKAVINRGDMISRSLSSWTMLREEGN